jgi:molybdopterin/thiamine biosynthesis adenylyltransferase
MSDMFVHEQLYRGDNLDKLQHYPILIAGCGALGSNLAEALVRHGSENITLLDMDRVEEKNLPCQIWADDDIGLLKVDALSNRLYDIMKVEASTINKKLDAKNIRKLLKNHEDGLIVDCFDNMESRRILKDYCSYVDADDGTPCIHAGLFESYGEVYWNQDYKVPANATDEAEDVCDYPLARNIIMLTVTVLCEEILDFILNDNPRMNGWNITLKDLNITKTS